MEEGRILSTLGMHIIDGCLIAPLGGDVDDVSTRRFQREILAKVEASPVRAALIDVSAVRVLDSFTFALLVQTAKMLGLLGTKTVFVGFQAGVASALVNLDIDTTGLLTAVNLEDAFDLLRHLGPTRRMDDENTDEMPENNQEDTLNEQRGDPQ